MFPKPTWRNRHPDVLAERPGLDRSDGRSEIGHIELAPQVLGNARLDEINNQVLTLLADVDTCPGVVQIDDDARLAILATAESHVLQRMALADRGFFGEPRHTLSQRSNGRNRRQDDIE